MFYKRVFTPELIKYMRENAHGVPIKDLTKMINNNFGIDLQYNQVRSAMRNYKIKCGVGSTFKPGHVPWSKGKKTGGGPPHTLFQKGHCQADPMPIGTETVRADGVWVKVGNPTIWRQKHRLVLEAENGPLPKGHAIIFGDGNNKNCSLDNLVLVNRKQLIGLNSSGMPRVNTEITKQEILIVDIQSKIAERNRKTKEAQ